MTRIFLSLLLGATFASAADQTILGTQLLVKDPGTPEKRNVSGKAKETGSPNTIVGDPTTSGATLTVRATGANPTQQTFTLPQGTSSKGKPLWTGDATKGFKYKDGDGVNGAVKKLQLKKSNKGVFSIKFNATGKLGAVSVVPPNPGDGGCVLLQLGGGDSYSVAFDDGEVTNKGATQFKVKKPLSEGSCVGGPTTTSTPSSTSSTSAPASTTTTTSTPGPTTTTLFAGPDFPPVGGSADFAFAGDANTAAGSQLSLFNFAPDGWTALYWGSWSAPSTPRAGLDGSLHALSFNGIGGGNTVVTWQGTTPWTDPSDMTVHVVPIRLTVTLVSPPSGVVWVDSTTIPGLDPGPGSGMGAAVDVAPAGTAQDFTVKFQYSADIPTDDPTGFIPLANVPTTGGSQVQTSFSGAFYSQP